MRKLFIKKCKGQGDLIASFFVILALTLFVFFFINTIGDVNTRLRLDQIGRTYILRMETSGGLTATEMEAIKQECLTIQAVKDATNGKTDNIKVTFNGDNVSRGYGSPITLEIVCPAYITSYTEGENIVGSIRRNKLINYTIRKQSTAKY